MTQHGSQLLITILITLNKSRNVFNVTSELHITTRAVSCGARVWKLEKGLYRLRQAEQSWYTELKASLPRAGFSVSRDESCWYMIKVQGEYVRVLVHVDDCLMLGSSAGARQVKDTIKALFDVKDTGAVPFFLGRRGSRG